MFTINNTVNNSLRNRILNKYKESNNDLKRKTVILNFIIYDNRVDRKFNTKDKEILQKRYDFLDYIWEYNDDLCPLIKLLLNEMNYVIPKKTIIKELKVIQNDTQSSTVNKYCTPSSIAESVVPSIAKNQELNIIGLPKPFVLRNLGGNQLGKLKLFTESNEKNIIDLNNSTNSNNNDNNNNNNNKNNNYNNNKNNNKNNNNNNNDLLFIYHFP